ncbi:hypothetical protein DM062_41330 [Klebsiella pneumoniae]|uniref:Uncharacterized protein n=2 Tax=Gammaproteobacteria TaxID=1236 RepID=A0A656AVT5_VIBCL|nr:hypothetical protein AN658_0226140 [Serratia marcescens]RCI91975.1 hypothetical protein DM062_41330 [Klebsiella pneumoniae]CSD41512.1 Uncharacterised protein [Vibrio cholerae]
MLSRDLTLRSYGDLGCLLLKFRQMLLMQKWIRIYRSVGAHVHGLDIGLDRKGSLNFRLIGLGQRSAMTLTLLKLLG